ncbi:MAG: hypothetical protein PHO23_01305 [Candidatus Pacebacteria bacterium]|nr:hypothetical protein [Candidatus Paceibacterota bacterium]
MEFLKLNTKEKKTLSKPIPVKLKITYQIIATIIIVGFSIFIITVQRQGIDNIVSSLEETKQKTYQLNDLVEYVSYLETNNKKAVGELTPYIMPIAKECDLEDIEKEIVRMANKYYLDPLFDYSKENKETAADLPSQTFNLLLTGSMKNVVFFLRDLQNSDILFFLKDMVAVKNIVEELPEDLKKESAKIETIVNLTEEEKQAQQAKLSNSNNYQVNLIGYVYLRKPANNTASESATGAGVEANNK